MKRIGQIIKKDPYLIEYGLMVVTPDSMIVFNGKIGIRYSKETNERLCSLAEKYGSYALPEPTKLLQYLEALKKITSADLDTKKKTLIVKFGVKGVLKMNVQTDLKEETTQLQIPWPAMGEDQEGQLPLSPQWEEFTNLVTREGEAMWGEVAGVYGKNKQLCSFDHGIYVHSEELDCGDFYCPLSFLELGFLGINYIYTKDGYIFMLGDNIQYVSVANSNNSIVDKMLHIKKDCVRGAHKAVTLDFTLDVWKRVKLFGSESIDLRIRNNEVFIYNNHWEECIGTTESDDCDFIVRASVLNRWGLYTKEHVISTFVSGECFLYGETREGLHFYASLTDTNPSKAALTTPPVEGISTEAKEVVSVGKDDIADIDDDDDLPF